jgi:uncharacterized membrane protein
VAGSPVLRSALLVAGAAAFVWLTSLSLPDAVASHFGAGGYANGFMPRGPYVGLMLAVVVGVPALLTIVTYFRLDGPRARINLPNRDYWLAPERRAETVSYLRGQLTWFGAVLVVFLCYVHWLVVRANSVRPPRLSTTGISVALAAFAMFVVLWTRLLLRRFRIRPSGRSG